MTPGLGIDWDWDTIRTKAVTELGATFGKGLGATFGKG